MKKFLYCFILCLPFCTEAQIGFKAGINFANVTKTSSLNTSNRSGFNLGIFLAPLSAGILSSNTELVFSRQGYNYKTNTNTGNVNLDYILLHQYLSVNITNYLSVLFGGHIAYLINAKVDSTGIPVTNTPADGILKYYQKFDFGYGGGVEVHPVSGLLFGARINIGLGNLFADLTTGNSTTPPSFVPKVNVKNNLFQIYSGWKFGGYHRK